MYITFGDIPSKEGMQTQLSEYEKTREFLLGRKKRKGKSSGGGKKENLGRQRRRRRGAFKSGSLSTKANGERS